MMYGNSNKEVIKAKFRCVIMEPTYVMRITNDYNC